MAGAGERDAEPMEGEPRLVADERPGVEHPWDDPIWGTRIAPSGLEERGGQLVPVELIADRLRAEGTAELGRFRRLTDYVNMLQGYFVLDDVTLLSRRGVATRLAMPKLRVRLDDIAVVGQRDVPEAPAPDPDFLVDKVRQHLVLMTVAHLVSGDVHVHSGGSITHFVDSPDPSFIPMSNVRVRWLDDRRLIGRFDFALVHRAKILGVAVEGLRSGR
jgi:hypothetical protein